MAAERLDVGSTDLHQLVDRATRVLGDDGVVILPTETMYAVAGRAASPDARRQLRLVRRPSAPAAAASQSAPPPLTLHLPSAAAASDVLGPSVLARGPMPHRLMTRLWPGPVGLVFDIPADDQPRMAERLGVPPEDLFDPQGRITLRCPDEPLTRAVLSAFPQPVACTQATDEHGRPAHRLADVTPATLDAARLALDAGPTRFNRPSTLLHVFPDHFAVLRAGVYDQRIVDRMLTTTLLFVCSGNTCRSPMAMALARKLLAARLGVREAELESRGYRVISAGTMAFPGSRATTQAVQAAGELGADLSAHRSQPLTVELIQQAQAIYTMGRSHKAMVLAMVPSAEAKTTTLDPTGDIEDPIGSDVSVYRELAHKLEQLIESRLDQFTS